MIDIVAAVGALLNGGWGLRFESKHAETEARLNGIEKLTDERDDRLHQRLDRIEEGQSGIRSLLVEALRK